MYKVLIVDDEVLVRVGLKSTIDWESIGFSVVAEASNGEQAYAAYKKHMPDVVLTDIRMPKKDGFWLIKMIRQESSYTKILILTCYNEFEYAREALKMGADNYILKSEAEDEELIRAMLEIKESLDLKSEENERYNYIKKQIDNNLDALKEKVFHELTGNDFKDWESIYSNCEDLKFDIKESNMCVLNILRDDREKRAEYSQNEWQNMNNAIVNLTVGLIEDRKISYISKIEEERFLFIISDNNLSMNKVKDMVEGIYSSVSQYFDVPISIITGAIVNEPEKISQEYKRITEKIDKIFYSSDGIFTESVDMTTENINIFGIKKDYEKLLLNYLDEEDLFKAIEIIKDTEGYFRENNVNSLDVKLFYSNLVSGIFERYGKCLEDSREDSSNMEYSSYHKRIMSVTKMTSLIRLVNEILRMIIKRIEEYRLENSNYIVKKAIDYIHDNFNKEISLQFLSEYLNLSKHYICYLFKKETGENITLYVNKLRIEKAKQLVLQSNCKIKEIYDQVGFSDQQYFSKMFKKLTGMTVLNYRDSVNQKNKPV